MSYVNKLILSACTVYRPHNADPILWLASLACGDATWTYFSVVVTRVWPRISCTTRICTPCSMSRVPAVWRASWRRPGRTPAAFRTAFHSRQSSLRSMGLPVGVAKTRSRSVQRAPAARRSAACAFRWARSSGNSSGGHWRVSFDLPLRRRNVTPPPCRFGQRLPWAVQSLGHTRRGQRWAERSQAGAHVGSWRWRLQFGGQGDRCHRAPQACGSVQPCCQVERCTWNHARMTPVSRSTYDQRRPSASPWRRPSDRATDQRAPLRRSEAAMRIRRASSWVNGSISASAAVGGSTSVATLRAILSRRTATLSARDRMRWILRTVLGERPAPSIDPYARSRCSG